MTGPGPTFEELAGTLRGAATNISPQLTEPDDDWIPIMVGQLAEGYVLPPVDLSPYLCSSMGADSLAIAVALWAKAISARRVALVLNAWYSPSRPNADGSDVDYVMDRPRPSEDLARKERLVLTVVELGRWESWHAEIIRTPYGPYLDEWEKAKTTTRGRFVDALQEVLI